MNLVAEEFMSLFRIGEVHGHAVDHDSMAAREDRAGQACPFKGGPCTKQGKKDPLGICSLVAQDRLVSICPGRFQEGGRVFVDAGRLAFGAGAALIAVPEVRVLRSQVGPKIAGKTQSFGKVDFLISALDASGDPVDFAALETQSVYFSGRELRTAYRHFIATGLLLDNSDRRPDWRSSAQKRLIPQLAEKVPVFRRWGKKVFVAVDSHFFRSMGVFPTVKSIENSEVTWLVYPFERSGARYPIGEPKAVFTTWDDIKRAIELAGEPPAPDEILAEIRKKRLKLGLPILRT
jgi:hypothetical protein